MLHEDRSELLFGRLAMRDSEAKVLAEICRTDGDHVEIGTLWGASAIIAAQNKPEPARVYSIDIMKKGFWETGDPGMPNREKPTAGLILSNFRNAGVADGITLIRSLSDPFPLPHLWPSTALIDGCHEAEGVRADWLNLSRITWRFIALHDYDEKHPALASVIENFILMSDSWQTWKVVDSMIILERTK